MFLKLIVASINYFWNLWREAQRQEWAENYWNGMLVHPADLRHEAILFSRRGWIYKYFWTISINIWWFGKWFFQLLYADYCLLTIIEHVLLIINILAIIIIINNMYIATSTFYQAHLLKIEFLIKIGQPELIWTNPWLFLDEIPELYWLHKITEFLCMVVWKICFGLLMIIPILLIIAYSTLFEWKFLSAIQRRWGPNRVGIKGSTQPLIDGIKLILKEIIVPVQSENWLFVLASCWSIFCMLLLWFIIPTSWYGNVLQFNYELLALFCVSILGSLAIILAGWASNSKYAFLGGIRAGAQIISYELVLGVIMLIIMASTCTTQIHDIVEVQECYGPLFLYLPAEAGIFMIVIVAETNRAPFDFAEAESELVSGYNTEYSGLPFAFFFIAEYGNILYMSMLTSLLFFGGWSVEFLPAPYCDSFLLESLMLWFKTIIIYIYFLWLRAALPRYWYDQLMALCWKIFLPYVLLSLMVWLILYSF